MLTKFTLTIVRTAVPLGAEVARPPALVDLTTLSPERKGSLPPEWFGPLWDTAEAVPMPKWEVPFENGTTRIQLFYRVAKVPVAPTLLGVLAGLGDPKATKVRFRQGGKGSRTFTECTLAEANDARCALLANMVECWGDPSGPGYKWDPTWEYLSYDLMWAKLPDGTQLDWACWGDSDEDGGTSLDPMQVAFTEETVKIPEVPSDPWSKTPDGSCALTFLRDRSEWYTKAADTLEQALRQLNALRS